MMFSNSSPLFFILTWVWARVVNQNISYNSRKIKFFRKDIENQDFFFRTEFYETKKNADVHFANTTYEISPFAS